MCRLTGIECDVFSAGLLGTFFLGQCWLLASRWLMDEVRGCCLRSTALIAGVCISGSYKCNDFCHQPMCPAMPALSPVAHQARWQCLAFYNRSNADDFGALLEFPGTRQWRCRQQEQTPDCIPCSLASNSTEKAREERDHQERLAIAAEGKDTSFLACVHSDERAVRAVSRDALL